MFNTTFIYFRTYAFFIFSVVAYLATRFMFNFSDYVAIIVANLACLAFLQAFDFKSDLKLEKLRQKQNESALSEHDIVFDYSKLISKTSQINVVIRVLPAHLFNYSFLNQAFSLKYIVDDTDKFISTFSERLKTQWYSNLIIALFLFILLKPSAEASVDYNALSKDPKEMLKVAITLAGTAINLLILWRPYWQCRERNKTVLNN